MTTKYLNHAKRRTFVFGVWLDVATAPMSTNRNRQRNKQSLAGPEVEVNKLNLRYHNTADAFPRPVLGSFEKDKNELGKFSIRWLARVIRPSLSALWLNK